MDISDPIYFRFQALKDNQALITIFMSRIFFGHLSGKGYSV